MEMIGTSPKDQRCWGRGVGAVDLSHGLMRGGGTTSTERTQQRSSEVNLARRRRMRTIPLMQMCFLPPLKILFR